MLKNRPAPGVRSRGPAVSVATCRALLAAVVGLLIVAAYYPFAWDPPHTVHNQVTRTAGVLRFGTVNQARTPGTPAWLAAVRRAGTVQIQLQADPRSTLARAPMMMLGSDFWHADFAIAQERTDLYLWLRRPGSRANGAPPLVVSGVIQAGHWVDVDVAVRDGGVSIGVDGRTRLTSRLPAGGLRDWAAGQIALGADVQGGFPWQGQIRVAEVRSPGYAVNYVRPGELSIPGSYLAASGHLEPFPPTDARQWLLAFLDLLTFGPAGFLIVCSRRPPVHPVPATLLAAGLAVALAAGKFLFHARHTSLADVLGQVLGACLGALVAWRLTRRARAGPGPASDVPPIGP